MSASRRELLAIIARLEALRNWFASAGSHEAMLFVRATGLDHDGYLGHSQPLTLPKDYNSDPDHFFHFLRSTDGSIDVATDICLGLWIGGPITQPLEGSDLQEMAKRVAIACGVFVRIQKEGPDPNMRNA